LIEKHMYFKGKIKIINPKGKVYERNPGIREHKEAGGGSGGRGGHRSSRPWFGVSTGHL
jgi:hypothetical protein